MHRKLDLLAPAGYAVLRDYDGPVIPPSDWLALTYLGARGDRETNFAPLATATGELDGRDFWAHGRPDRHGQWTANRAVAPALARYVAEVGASFGRVRVVKAAPGTEGEAMRRMQRGDCNRLNPDGSPWVVRSMAKRSATIIVPVSPGGGVDTFARLIAAKSPSIIRRAKESLNGIDPVDVKRSYRFEQGFTYELHVRGVADEQRAAFVDKRDADTSR